MKKYIIFIAISTIMFGCRHHNIQRLNCEKYPDNFLTAYFPFRQSEVFKYVHNDKNMSFAVSSLEIFESFTHECNTTLFDCERNECPSNMVLLFSAETELSITYYICALQNNTMDISITFKESSFVEKFTKTFQTTPYAENVFDILGEKVELNANNDRFIQVEITRNKGISSFTEQFDNGEIRKWTLVE